MSYIFIFVHSLVGVIKANYSDLEIGWFNDRDKK